MIEKISVFIIGTIGVLALALLLALFNGWVIMISINYVFTPAVILSLFGATTISFWKAYILAFLLGSLFKSSSSSSKS